MNPSGFFTGQSGGSPFWTWKRSPLQ